MITSTMHSRWIFKSPKVMVKMLSTIMEGNVFKTMLFNYFEKNLRYIENEKGRKLTLIVEIMP